MSYYKSFGSPGHDGFKYAKHDARDPHVQNSRPSAILADRDASSQPSGAYLFRPSVENEIPECITNDNGNIGDSCNRKKNPVQLSVIQHSNFAEVRQTFSDWAFQTVRVYANDPVLEMEWTVGDVPIDDQIGKEIISKFTTTNMNSGPKGRNVVYTDSNGREFEERVLNYRPTWDLQVHEPVAGNFYPLTTAMYIKGDITSNGISQKAQLSVLVDRAQAGASLESGEMELMIHRRLLADDYRGVGEALNETSYMSPYPDWQRSGKGIVVSGKHKVLLSHERYGMRELRGAIDTFYSPLTILNKKINDDFDDTEIDLMSLGLGLGFDLPVNINLLTLVLKDENTLLVRLAHQFAVDEDEQLSQPVKINVQELLKAYNVVPGSLQEWTLSYNQLKKDQLANKINWRELNNHKKSSSLPLPQDQKEGENVASANSMEIILLPMQIRTLTVQVQQSS